MIQNVKERNLREKENLINRIVLKSRQIPNHDDSKFSEYNTLHTQLNIKPERKKEKHTKQKINNVQRIKNHHESY